MYELALFAGAGGGILGGKLLGWKTVGAVEIDEYARRVLLARQDDGCLEPFPIWDDVRTFDGKPWRGVVDIVTGGFPCQDISAAGKGAGIDGARSGLWGEMARIICEVGPRFVLVENSPMLTSRGLGRVVGDLAAMGYDARWGVLGAVHAGAPHKRERIWIVANASSGRCGRPRGGEDEQPRRAETECAGETVADPSKLSERESTDEINSLATGGEAWNESVRRSESGNVADPMRGRLEAARQPREVEGPAKKEGGSGNQSALSAEHCREGAEDVHDAQRFGCDQGRCGDHGEHERPESQAGDWWLTEPDVGRVAHGVAARVDRLRCLGNGQVSAVVRLAWRLLAPKE
jgi:DNA (cytosine-5)-methyltransferase 1